MLAQGRPQFCSGGNGAFSWFRGISTQAGISCGCAETPSFVGGSKKGSNASSEYRMGSSRTRRFERGAIGS